MLLVAALGLLIAAFHLYLAVSGRSIFRASPMGTALVYSQNGIDLLRPEIVGFNATGTPTLLEFPLWQAATAMLFKLTGSTWYGWGNIVSLAIFATVLWPLLQLGKKHLGARVAWWGLVFFLAQPLIIMFAGEGSADGLSLVATIWFLYFADLLVRQSEARLKSGLVSVGTPVALPVPSLWSLVLTWLGVTLFASLSAVMKLPFYMTAGLLAVFVMFLRGIRPNRTWVWLGAAALVSGVVFYSWTKHGDAMAAQAEFPYVEMRLSESEFIRHWYFGDLAYRLSPAHWAKAAWRFVHGTMGTVALLLPFGAALLRPGQGLLKLWLAAAAVTTLVFTHLVLEHWHYYLMVCPAVAFLCAATISRWDQAWALEMPRSWMRTGLLGGVLVVSAVQGLITMRIAIDLDPFPKDIAAFVRQHTDPTDKLLLFQQDPNWGGEVLFRAGRQGLVFSLEQAFPGGPAPKGLRDVLGNPRDLARLKELGYNKLVLIGESPVRFAIEASNPGRRRERRPYPTGLPGTADWPEVFRSADLLIQTVP